MARTRTPRRWRHLALSAVLGLALALTTAAAAVPAQAATQPLPPDLFVTKRFWTMTQGNFPVAPPVWWSTTNYTFTTTEGPSGTFVGVTRRWQQTKDGIPTRVTVATIPGCNPTPAKGEGTDCPVYGTVPTHAYTASGTFTFDAASGMLTLVWNMATATPSAHSLMATEQWRIDLSHDGKLGKAYAVNRPYAQVNARTTDGVGYGSATPFTRNAPREDMHKADGRFWLGQSLTMESGRRSGWKLANMPSIRFEPHPSLSEISSWTQILPNGAPNSSCRRDQLTMAGITHFLWTSSTTRDVVWESYRRCLVARGVAPYVDGKYRAGMHVEMLSQILDDDGKLVGLLGGEASAAGTVRNKGWGSHSLHNLVERPHFGRILGWSPSEPGEE